MVGKGMTKNAASFWITEPYQKHRVKRVTSRIPAPLRETPVGHQGGGP